MSGARWVAVGALWMGVAVVLGAFGAHALEERLTADGMLASWETGVRYQAWHALGLIALGLVPPRVAPSGALWLLLAGSVLFSGSLYGLALGGPGALLGPVTPLGGALLIAGWAWLGVSAWRSAARA